MRVIAIDGPAGSGKSTVARALAERLGMECLDTGAMFRAVAFAVLRVGGDPFDEDFVADVARTVDVRMEEGRVIVDGHDATVEIRGPAVTSAVSAVATNAAVRSELAARQREWVRRRGGGVLEGRDIGTVVFPTAELKIYLTADPAVRARRRAHQDLCKEKELVEAVAANLAARDRIDITRSLHPLTEAEGAVVVDTTHATCEETLQKIMGLL